MSETSAPAPELQGQTIDEGERLCAELRSQVAEAKARVQQAYLELEAKTQLPDA